MKLEEHIFQSESFVELIEEAVNFMVNTPMESLPPEQKFAGAVCIPSITKVIFLCIRKSIEKAQTYQFM